MAGGVVQWACAVGGVVQSHVLCGASHCSAEEDVAVCNTCGVSSSTAKRCTGCKKVCEAHILYSNYWNSTLKWSFCVN